MFKVNYTVKAEADLNNIHDYIALDNPPRAVTYIKELRAVTDNLAIFPYMGSEIGGNPNNRRLVHGNYKIIYKILKSKRKIFIKQIKNCAQKD